MAYPAKDDDLFWDPETGWHDIVLVDRDQGVIHLDDGRTYDISTLSCLLYSPDGRSQYRRLKG